MQERQWKATWTGQQGETHRYTFIAPDHRLLAEIDVQHVILTRTGELLEYVTLEAGRLVVRVVPTLEELVRKGQL